MKAPAAKKKEVSGAAWLRAALLLLWAAASFGVAFFARDLNQVVAGWPLNYWWLAQGGVLLFIGVVMVYAWWMGRAAPAADDEDR
ncbi:MAG: DUF4212 domain-containing protein [Ottowia sp.]|jgi:cation/acetate symporter|nr:DUF4212 domain-containing protein [Ottowia sp.]OJV60786.1 MAG: hypothetical protein BGO36_02655 [Burkholderiales bacterium 68-10]